MQHFDSHPERTRSPRVAHLALTFLALALAIVASPLTSARADGAQADAYRPAMNVDDGLGQVESARLAPPGEWSLSLDMGYVRDPLVLDSHDGITSPNAVNRGVVTGQTYMHLMGTYTPIEWLELGLDLPFIVHQTGDELVGFDSPLALEGGGIGDLRLGAKLQLFSSASGESWGRVRVALNLEGGLPTGDGDNLQGGGGWFAPLAIIEWETTNAIRLVGNIGYTWRPRHEVLNVVYGDTVTWAAGVEVPLIDELRIFAGVRGDQATEATLSLGWDFFEGFELIAYGGAGLVDDPMTPAYRVGATVSYRRGGPADDDRDGRPDDVDACPQNPEDIDGFEDEDGCPDPDNDQDGVLDAVDQCATSAEDRDAFEDEDGCPDTDNDADGVTDAFDHCPVDAEDHDGFEDSDGCPEADNDRDGILDVNDRCPTDAEDVDGDQDEDGCPDVSHASSIDVTIYFERNSTEISAEARYPLTRVARTIIALPDHLHVWIEGYADEHGTNAANVALSTRRAQEVYDVLVAEGVPREQIDIQAYGERAPAYANDTDVDRGVNRRVEFRVGPRSMGPDAGEQSGDSE